MVVIVCFNKGTYGYAAGVIHLSLNCASDFAKELYADGTFGFGALVVGNEYQCWLLGIFGVG